MIKYFNFKPIVIAIICIILFEIISSLCIPMSADSEIADCEYPKVSGEAKITNSESILDARHSSLVTYEEYDNKMSEGISAEIIEAKSYPDPVVESDPNTWYYPMTDDELNELATLVYLEGGIASYECQEAIASVVINRATTSDKSTHDVIYAKHQFTPANKITQSEPSESTLKAAKHVAMYGPSIPEYVTFFRANYFFDWGDRYINYTVIDRTYFSYDSKLKQRLESDI